MKKFNIIYFILLACMITRCQYYDNNKPTEITKEEINLYFEDGVYELNLTTPFDSLTDVYADSLNTFKSHKKVPNFLFDCCWGIHETVQTDVHHRVSLRQLMISKLEDIASINLLLTKESELNRCQMIDTTVSYPILLRKRLSILIDSKTEMRLFQQVWQLDGRGQPYPSSTF